VTDVQVRDSSADHRFDILVDGTVAGFAAYRDRDGVVVITHSEIDPEFQGQGLGGQLAAQTLNLLRERDARVRPVCPFFADYVAKHHDWDDILVED
jgi:predicted GNAT family acetyltransferase